MKKQLAGLFQNLLMQEAVVTEEKTLHDMQKIAEDMKDILDDIRNDKEEIEESLMSRNIVPNFYFKKLRDVFGLKKIYFNFSTLDGLIELLVFLKYKEVGSTKSTERIFKNNVLNGEHSITINLDAFEKDGRLKLYQAENELENYIIYEWKDDNDLPF